MSGSGASGSGRRRGRPPVCPPDASSSGADASTSGRKKRGEAKATDTWRRAHGTFHDVEISPFKSFVGRGGNEIRNFLSSIANNELRMPHMIHIDGQWIPVDWTSPQLQPYKDRALTEVMGRFRFKWVTGTDDDSLDESEVDETIAQEIVLKYIDGSWRDHKHKIRCKVKKANTPEEIDAAKPNNWSSDYWAAMLQHFNSEAHLERSERGQIAQGYCEDRYRGGGKGASERGYEIYQAEGHWPDRSVIYDQLFVRADDTEASQEARERSDYTCSKTLSEYELLNYKATKENNGMEVVSLACGLVGGDALLPNAPLSVQMFVSPLTGDPLCYRQLKFLQSLIGSIPIVHIQDICDAHVFCMEKSSISGRYLCASDHTTIQEFVEYYEHKYPCARVTKEFEGTEGRVRCNSEKLIESGFQYRYGLEQVLDDSVVCMKRLEGLEGL